MTDHLSINDKLQRSSDGVEKVGEPSTVYKPALLPDLLPIYYKRLFPYPLYYRWLSYGGVNKKYFKFREFSFTLEGDVYVRYQSFADQGELEKEMVKKVPHKIDLGAVYNDKPSMHRHSQAFAAQEKELVFDIDMTDYDDVRTCCSGADICSKCWPLMTVAMKIIDTALREDFGYAHLLWVYSGRRGVHCWVCDAAARRLSTPARTAVADYLSLVRGGENQYRKVILPPSYCTHPSIKRALKIVNRYFPQLMLRDQDILGDDPEQWSKILRIINDGNVRSSVEESLKRCKTPNERMACLEDLGRGAERRYHRFADEVKLQHTYPRLDINVSKDIGHLLKSPFCIHPKTGRVCVPIDIDAVDAFNPETVPTISGLCDEINSFHETATEEEKKMKDYKKTSLKGSIQVFERFLKQLEKSRAGQHILNSDLAGEF